MDGFKLGSRFLGLRKKLVGLGDLFQECHRRFEERGIQAVIINFSSCDGWWSYVSFLIQDGLPTGLGFTNNVIADAEALRSSV